MYSTLPTIGTLAWQHARRGFKSRYVLRDTVGPVQPDQGQTSVTGVWRNPRHRGGLTIAPAPTVPPIPQAMIGILHLDDELEAAGDFARKYDKENGR